MDFLSCGSDLPAYFFQFRLVVERVHLAWTAVHHEEDAALGLARVTWPAGCQWIRCRLAKRVRDDKKLETAEAQISKMFRLTLNREATPVELANAKVYLEDLTAPENSLRELAQALFNLKEFIYLQ